MRILVGDLMNTSLWPNNKVNQIISQNVNNKYSSKSEPAPYVSDSCENVTISDEAMELYKKDSETSQA